MLIFRPLDYSNPEDIAVLQSVLEDAPKYSVQVKGHLPLPSDAEDLFNDLPPGKSLDDKLIGGFWKNDLMIGCVDICRGYPEPQIAFIGLLLFSEKYQRRGNGHEALTHIRALVGSWNCLSARVAVIEKNLSALQFWKREGFSELYRKIVKDYTGEAIVMESKLQQPLPL